VLAQLANIWQSNFVVNFICIWYKAPALGKLSENERYFYLLMVVYQRVGIHILRDPSL